MTAEEMIAALLEPNVKNEGVLANDLWGEFSKGFPIGNLKRLIYSENQDARGNASFIARGLATEAAPLLQDVATLLNHTSPSVRRDVLETLWICATYNDGWAIATVLRCLEHSCPYTRKSAINAIRLANRDSLLAGFRYLEKESPNTIFARFRLAFKRAERGNNQIIEKLVHDPNPTMRKFGAGLAARPRLAIDTVRLELVTKSLDTEISKYGAEAETNVLPPWGVLSHNL